MRLKLPFRSLCPRSPAKRREISGFVTAFLGWALISLISIPALADDWRFGIDVYPDVEQNESISQLHADVRAAAEKALQVLWDRLILQAERRTMPKKMSATRFLLRADPTAEGVRVYFDPQRVKDFLQSRNITFIEQPPAFALRLKLRGASGLPLTMLENRLQSFARNLARRYGFELSDSGHALHLNWQWLNHDQVSLNVEGGSLLTGYTEVRKLQPGDDLSQMQAWLAEVVLLARDQQSGQMPDDRDAYLAELPEGMDTMPEAGPAGVWLTIEHTAPLPEQILFEADLRAEPRIRELVPYRLNRHVRQYRIELKQPDDTWLAQWLVSHGFHVEKTEQGWVAR